LSFLIQSRNFIPKSTLPGKKVILFRFLILVVFLLRFSQEACAQQDERDVIQFSGVVTTNDTTAGIIGAHVYVPQEGRGTTTNYYGYFNFPVLEGDSVVISVVGYQRATLTIPEMDDDNYSYSVIVTLREDTTYLPELEVMPFPTEEMFKEAVLAYRLPGQGDLNNMQDNLDPAILSQMYRDMGMDGSMNHRYFTQQQAIYLHDAYGPRYNPLLNPFAWAEFFKSFKKKKKK
jgi:hypothetical protein